MTRQNQEQPGSSSLLQRWLQQKGTTGSHKIPRSSVEGPIPLSFAQKRLWFLEQMMPHSTGYYLPFAFQMKGVLCVQTLEKSFQELIKRHSALRTTFPTIQGEPNQAISPHISFSLQVEDVRNVAEEKKVEQVEQLVNQEIECLFDLSKGPLFRVKLFHLQDDEWILFINLHHMITDGWSNGVLIKELGILYQSILLDQPSLLPELEVQYSDVTYWQYERFQDEASNRDLIYWKERLSGAPSLIQLPLDYPRPAMQTSKGAYQSISLPASTLQAFHSLCRKEHVSINMGLLSVWNVLLHRYTGQNDLLIGLPVHNRQRQETESVMGFFANTVVVRTDLSDELSFLDLLQQVRKEVLQAYEHQDYPFEKLVEVLQPPRDTSYSPIFQVMMSIGAGSLEKEIQWPNLSLIPYECKRTSANFDLTLEVTSHSDDLQLGFLYRTDLFDADTIERMAVHFTNLIEQCIENPSCSIKKVPLITNEERQKILVKWNQTEVSYPEELCLHQLVEEQARRTPDAIAVEFEGQSLTYHELDQQANRLAHVLVQKKVEPGSLVGISMERSLELVIGLLGILKAGAAYVPIDPSYPPDRIAYMLEDSQVLILLTQKRYVSELHAYQAQVVCLDEDWEHIQSFPCQSPQVETNIEQVAYMIYTSGSTGKPKGARNSHRAICNRLLWMQDQYQLTEQDCVLQKTPFSFDVSVWEFFWPLITGVKLVLARPDGHKDANYLLEIIQKEQVTTLHFVPSMLQVFLQEPGVDRCDSIRQVICSGEALPYDLQERFFSLLDAELHNLYGPTEAAVDVTYWKCGQTDQRKTVPIGRPVANTQIYILDSYLQPVPIGVTGELYIGGVQVGMGYWQRPELTAEKFIPDPFGKPSSDRLYRTGDLARFRVDGTIEYLGRIDHQVKIRGLRVELGELEAILADHPSVREVVVIVYESRPGNQRLVAYYTSDAPLEGNQLRRFMAERIPEFMIPSWFLYLEVMPLSPNGKLDRKLLPTPQMTDFVNQKELVLPSNELERQIAEIWKEVLQISQVGTQDHFFDLGGHSLLVTQVRSQLQEKLGIQISMVDLFRFTTIQALASHIRSQQSETPSSFQQIRSRAEKQREAMRRNRQRRR